MLESMAVDWSQVLDLYAGTGAMGIEALSRGAEWADFVERDARSCALIKENLEHTGLSAQGKVYCMPASKAISTLDKRYGVIFLDPPYNDPNINDILEQLVSSRLVREESTIVLEHSRRLSPREDYGIFHLVKDRRHGDSSIAIYQSTGGED